MSDAVWLLVSIVILVVGGAFGFWLGRRSAPDQQRIRELEASLEQSRSEMNQYRDEVQRHFQHTAERVNAVTEAYRELYRHLADSSHKLAPGPAEQLLESAGEQALLEQNREEPEPARKSAPGPGRPSPAAATGATSQATATDTERKEREPEKEPEQQKTEYELPKGAIPTARARAAAAEAPARHDEPASVPEDADAEAGGAHTHHPSPEVSRSRSDT